MTLTIDMAAVSHWAVLLVIAALAGLLVELARGGGMPLGFVGCIAAALVGAWVFSDLLHPRFPIIPQPTIDNVPLVPAAIGALIAAILWGLLGGRSRR
jgi:uncharacterized membrane protein YeaQ/YmgE (transglycosylase-associated protein family)